MEVAINYCIIVDIPDDTPEGDELNVAAMTVEDMDADEFWENLDFEDYTILG